MSRPTFSELAWPMDADSRQQAGEWAEEVTTRVLGWTFRAFDTLRTSTLGRIDLNQPLEQLERDLTSHHFREIQYLWKIETDGYSALYPHHEWPEMATRSPAPAKPPAYDFAFVWSDNPRVAWPIEAKVVPTARTLAEYISDTAKFTGGVAAPFVGEGAQVAYLLTGATDEFFSALAARISVALEEFSDLSVGLHRISFHLRDPAPDLRLHHVALACGSEKQEIS